jgi:Right handed beta helix region
MHVALFGSGDRRARSSRRGGLLAFLFAAAALPVASFVAAPPVDASTAYASISGTAYPGALVGFSGHGFRSSGTYLIQWGRTSPAMRILWTSTTGSFAAHLRIPTTASVGSHQIHFITISKTLASFYSRNGISRPPIPAGASSTYTVPVSVKAPPTTTPPPTTCTRTVNVDATGATDVTSALQSFVNASPNGSVVCFKAGGTYKVNGQLHISNRNHLRIEGNGARIRQAVRGTKAIVLVDYGSTDITIRNLTIQGSNPSPGLWSLTYEHNHGLDLRGTLRVDIGGVRVVNVGGDGFYLAGGYLPGGAFRWADSIHVHDSLVDGTGRMGVAVTDGLSNTVIDHSTFRHIAYYTLDFEANGHVFNGVAAGAAHVRFSDNTLASQPYSGGGSGQPTGHLFVVTGTSGGGPADDIEVSRNSVSGRAVDVGVYNNGGLRRNIRVVDNHSDTRVGGPVMSFSGVNTVRVTGNTQPLSNTTLVSTSGCTSVTISANVIR